MTPFIRFQEYNTGRPLTVFVSQIAFLRQAHLDPKYSEIVLTNNQILQSVLLKPAIERLIKHALRNP